uniref:GATA-specific transcription factor, putative n=1 Tax=Theileria annulata TaxID=5874 RepID=A0A3B0MWE6_THEAN
MEYIKSCSIYQLLFISFQPNLVDAYYSRLYQITSKNRFCPSFPVFFYIIIFINYFLFKSPFLEILSADSIHIIFRSIMCFLSIIFKMQTNSDNNLEKKDSMPKYFSENVYKEIVKSLSEFQKRTANAGENMNMANRDEPEIDMDFNLNPPSDQQQSFAYSPNYMYSQDANGRILHDQTGKKIPEYNTVMNSNECILQRKYEPMLSESNVMKPGDDCNKISMTKFEEKAPLEETEMSSDLIKCVKSPQTSPNLLPTAAESFNIKNELNGPQMMNEVNQSDLRPNGEEQKKFYSEEARKMQYQNKTIDYGCINYDPCGSDNRISDPGYYYSIPYDPRLFQKKQNIEENLNYMMYKPEKAVAYFNSIIPVFDDETNTYYPNYQVDDQNNPNIINRQTMFRNGMINTMIHNYFLELLSDRNVSPFYKYITRGQNYNLPNPYGNIESYYKTNSMKQDIGERYDQIDSNDQNGNSQGRIAIKPKQEKKRNSRSTSAGRPKLNRNHYSCSNCNVKTTPQWRYYKGVAVCNACYMRIRKDKTQSTQNPKGKNKKK